MRYLLIILLAGLSSCYTRPRAAGQFAKASISFPDIPADYCARVYPPKTNIVKGDTVTTYDTIYTGGGVTSDTVIVMDTKYITKTIQLPGERIIERVTIRDTLLVENTAALDLCAIERKDATLLATHFKDKYDRSRKWMWIALALGATTLLGFFLAFKRKAAPAWDLNQGPKP